MPVTGAERARRYRTTHPDKRLSTPRVQKHREQEREKPPTFVAVDGEGWTDKAGIHHYTLLAASDGSTLAQWGGDIDTQEALEWLIDLGKAHSKTQIVSFFFSYDVNMILRDLGEDTIEVLHRTGRCEWRGKDGTRYLIEFIKTKLFQVSRTRWSPTKATYIAVAKAKVWDVFGFFQCSFVAALREWKVLDGAELDQIAAMKDKRGEFSPGDEIEVQAYCLSECEQLVKLMDKLASTLWEVGLPLQQWHGAGAVANEMMRQHGMKAYLPDESKLDRDVQEAILHAYFGGRTETYGAGLAPADVYAYDINSAYPAALVDAPDLAYGYWKPVTRYQSNTFSLWHVKYDTTKQPPFPHRLDKAIYWPQNGEGWYHGVEVQAALESKYPLTIIRGYVWITSSKAVTPWKWIRKVYADRRKYKENGDPRNVPLKLGLNSLYGKLAQGVGANGRRAPYQCYALAGYVTAYCRATMIRAIQQCKLPVGVATDGLFTMDKLNLPISGELGAWERKGPYKNVIVVQPGFMMSEDTGTFQRSRGTPRNTVSYDTFLSAWKKDGLAAQVVTLDTRFVGMGKALRSTDFNGQWRRWTKAPRVFSFYPSRKTPNCEAITPWCPLKPIRFSGPHFSEPYEPKQWINASDDPEFLALDEDMEQPDYA